MLVHYTLPSKLHLLQSTLTDWRKNTFGSISADLRSLERRIGGIHSSANYHTSDFLSALEFELQQEYSRKRLQHEIFWKQRSRVMWLREGDRNTKFFHRMAKQNFKCNHILYLLNDSGQQVTSPQGLLQLCQDYFSKVFSCTNMQPRHTLAAGIPQSISEADNLILSAVPTVEEIREAVFSIHSEKAPGPDGYNALFYQRFWSLVCADVELLVRSFFNHGFLDTQANETCITLIPKS